MPFEYQKNILVAHFGYGDIAVDDRTAPEFPGEGALLFHWVEPGEVGRSIDSPEGFDDVPLAILFKNVGGVDVVAEMLGRLRVRMIADGAAVPAAPAPQDEGAAVLAELDESVKRLLAELDRLRVSAEDQAAKRDAAESEIESLCGTLAATRERAERAEAHIGVQRDAWYATVSRLRERAERAERLARTIATGLVRMATPGEEDMTGFGWLARLKGDTASRGFESAGKAIDAVCRSYALDAAPADAEGGGA